MQVLILHIESNHGLSISVMSHDEIHMLTPEDSMIEMRHIADGSFALT